MRSPTDRRNRPHGRAYHRAMRCAVGLMIATITIVACSGSDAEPPPSQPAPAVTSAPSPDAPPETASTETSVTSAADTTAETTTTTENNAAPTTTIDEDAILAEAEAAYFEAWQVGTDAIRNPDDPANETRIRDHFAKNNLVLNLENIRLTEEGNFIAKENVENPSFPQTYGDIEFTTDARDEVSLTVCEFYSDRLYERGTAPDGADTLIRDDPSTTILVVEMVLEDGKWKSATGGPAEVISDEVERCSSAS